MSLCTLEQLRCANNAAMLQGTLRSSLWVFVMMARRCLSIRWMHDSASVFFVVGYFDPENVFLDNEIK